MSGPLDKKIEGSQRVGQIAVEWSRGTSSDVTKSIWVNNCQSYSWLKNKMSICLEMILYFQIFV